MLRSFSRHFNDTVFRGPDTDAGADPTLADTSNDDVGGSDDVDSGDSAADSPGEPEEPQKPLSVREELKRSIEEQRQADEKAAKPKRDKKAAPASTAGKTEATPATAAAPATAQDDIAAPASLSAEAKAAWANAPKEIKEAFVKREADMQRGVDELKQRYQLIDDAIAPHNDALRQMNATPAQAVDRMFQWFKALAGSPANAFPALVQSMGYDWNKLVQAAGQSPQQGDGQGQAQEGAPVIAPEVRDYISRLEQQIQNLNQGFQSFGGRFQTMEESVQAQNMARTTENLNIWSKDKPYFDEVRTDMAHLLQSGLVPLKPDGQVDLDTAYERAIYFNPAVRAKVIAEQQQADLKARQESEQAATVAQQVQTEKARKASVSIPARSTPGDGNGAKSQQRKPGQKLSVRESLKAALSELRDQ